MIKEISNEVSQICLLTLKTSGNLFKEQNKVKEAIQEYQSAFNFIKVLYSEEKRGKQIANISPPFNKKFIKIKLKINTER